MHLLVGDMVGEWFISDEKEELLTALGNSSFLFLLQQLKKCVCETEGESCVSAEINGMCSGKVDDLYI